VNLEYGRVETQGDGCCYSFGRDAIGAP
jgi:hypothetical protein